MTTINSATNYIVINGTSHPLNSFRLSPILGGVRLTGYNFCMDVMASEAVVDGAEVSSVTELLDFLNTHCFSVSGGGGGGNDATGMLYFEDTQFDGDGTEADPIRIK